MNDERPIGMCANLFDSAPARCRRAPDATAEGLRLFDYVNGDFRATACAFLLDEDGNEMPAGWIVWQDACEAYAERYPGTFTCWRPEE